MCIRGFAFAAVLVLAPHALAQSGPQLQQRPNLQRQLRAMDTYDIEVANGRSGRIEFSAMGNQAVTGFGGTAFGDPLIGRRDIASPGHGARPVQQSGLGGEMAWVTTRHGRPHEAFVAQYHRDSGYWVGVAYGLDVTSDLATPARSAWAFRMRLSLHTTRPGIAPLGPPPALRNPAGAAQPFNFGQTVQRTYPIMSGETALGRMTLEVQADGTTTGAVSAANRVEVHSGYYARNAGTLALARLSTSSTTGTGSNRSYRGVALDLMVATLNAGQLMSGELVRVTADATPFRRAWTLGPVFRFANMRHDGCLSFQADTIAAGAQAWLNDDPSSDRLIPCSATGATRNWSFLRWGADAFQMVNLYSGLCLSNPTERNGPYTQETCVTGENQLTFYIAAVTNSPIPLDPDQYTFVAVPQVDQITDYTIIWIHGLMSRCPGSFNNSLPMVLDVCNDSRGYQNNSRGLWRLD
jgi:hypothetical protein